MEDRILIDGVAYVKESKNAKVVEHEIMYSKEMQIDVWDTDIMVVANCLDNEEFSKPSMVSIDIKKQPGTELLEAMDNEVFLRGVANRDAVSMRYLNECKYSSDVLSAVVVMCDKIKELKWI